MNVVQLTAKERTTINWASGTSTEIFIYPSNATFAERNFLFRISTATVEAETSTFTFFEGITRHLMLLKGELELIHVGRYTKHLKPYEQDVFSGEWDTHSKGKVTDFNLMLKNGATGTLIHHYTAAQASTTYTADSDYYFLYLASGKATLSNGNALNAKDLLWIGKGTDIVVHAQEPCDIIAIEVFVYPDSRS
ncbi:MAG TPA: HutD family protein [Flavipsychrobacter sp.]